MLKGADDRILTGDLNLSKADEERRRFMGKPSVHAADVRHLQRPVDLYSSGVRLRALILSGHHYQTSNVLLLLYNTSEVYTKSGMVSG